MSIEQNRCSSETVFKSESVLGDVANLDCNIQCILYNGFHQIFYVIYYTVKFIFQVPSKFKFSTPTLCQIASWEHIIRLLSCRQTGKNVIKICWEFIGITRRVCCGDLFTQTTNNGGVSLLGFRMTRTARLRWHTCTLPGRWRHGNCKMGVDRHCFWSCDHILERLELV